MQKYLSATTVIYVATDTDIAVKSQLPAYRHQAYHGLDQKSDPAQFSHTLKSGSDTVAKFGKAKTFGAVY